MMLWLHGRDPDERSDPTINGVYYFIGHKLSKTITEVKAMPTSELVAWCAYFTAKSAVESRRPGGGPA